MSGRDASAARWRWVQRGAIAVAAVGVVLSVMGQLSGLYGWVVTSVLMAASVAAFAILNHVSEARLDVGEDPVEAEHQERAPVDD